MKRRKKGAEILARFKARIVLEVKSVKMARDSFKNKNVYNPPLHA